ncbi:MAG: glycoside hydrolase family 125 protein [Paenibacillaceae bacterium]
MKRTIDKVAEQFPDQLKLAQMFEHCFSDTFRTTVKRMEDQSTFVITGDIPAMWLRDSAAQVRGYLYLAHEDKEMADLIEGVVRRQVHYILKDPYANAFNEEPNGRGHQADLTEMNDWIWERKYEIDSLCSPIQLSYLLWKTTGRTSHFDENFKLAVHAIIHLWKVEQNHDTQSNYSFQRLDGAETDTLTNEGKGSRVKHTGMTWSGFRPSDDACQYGYHIPSNMFAVVVLGYVSEIAGQIWGDNVLKDAAEQLADEIDRGIQAFGIVHHPQHGNIYAYETDGYGNYNLMDDANVPSLLSIPYLGYRAAEDPIYLNTRSFVLSQDNPYFYKGKAAEGIGSPHTPDQYIWHISLAIQGLTATEFSEKERMLQLLIHTDAGTNCMHEGFLADDPSQFTRPWFSWANALFSEFVLDYLTSKSMKYENGGRA